MLKTDTELLANLQSLCGFVEDGTSDVVTISRDDVTMDWCVTVKYISSCITGTSYYYGDTFRDVLNNLPERKY